jgi:hypothetical protein
MSWLTRLFQKIDSESQKLICCILSQSRGLHRKPHLWVVVELAAVVDAETLEDGLFLVRLQPWSVSDIYARRAARLQPPRALGRVRDEMHGVSDEGEADGGGTPAQLVSHSRPDGERGWMASIRTR